MKKHAKPLKQTKAQAERTEIRSMSSEVMKVIESVRKEDIDVGVEVTTSNPEIETAILNGYRDIGMPFIAYMLLPNIDYGSASLQQDFHSLYAGKYDNQEEVVKNWFGRLCSSDVVSADPIDMMFFIKEYLDLVGIAGTTYVFFKQDSKGAYAKEQAET